jgi:gamma-glutamyltranspeptidase/glutathione hydrolase
VPVAGLLDPAYLAERMNNFDPGKATPSALVPRGKPRGWEAIAALDAPRPESPETTHYSVVDAAGNAVANTYTLNTSFGSGVTIPGTGFLMNNEMDDFTAKAGAPNFFGLIQGAANAIQPGKRPLSAMTPTIVLKDSQLFLVTGAPGGSTIPNALLQVISNVIDHHMPVGLAVEAPRIHHQWMPDVINHDPFGLAKDVADALRAKGHQLYGPEKIVPFIENYSNDTMTIMIDPATRLRLGAADPRKPDARAVGY